MHSDAPKIKVFSHTFKNGKTLTIKLDLSKDMPWCESNDQIDKQPKEMLEEYRIWQENVVVPEMMKCLSLKQLYNFAEYAIKKIGL